MTTLSDISIAANAECSEETAYAIKRLLADPNHKLACDYIIYGLSATNDLAASMSNDPQVMAWYTGRRFVGLALVKIFNMPVSEKKLSPARTAIAKQERRIAGQTQPKR